MINTTSLTSLFLLIVSFFLLWLEHVTQAFSYFFLPIIHFALCLSIILIVLWPQINQKQYWAIGILLLIPYSLLSINNIYWHELWNIPFEIITIQIPFVVIISKMLLTTQSKFTHFFQSRVNLILFAFIVFFIGGSIFFNYETPTYLQDLASDNYAFFRFLAIVLMLLAYRVVIYLQQKSRFFDRLLTDFISFVALLLAIIFFGIFNFVMITQIISANLPYVSPSGLFWYGLYFKIFATILVYAIMIIINYTDKITSVSETLKIMSYIVIVLVSILLCFTILEVGLICITFGFTAKRTLALLVFTPLVCISMFMLFKKSVALKYNIMKFAAFGAYGMSLLYFGAFA